MKRVLLVGPVGCGKSTFSRQLRGVDLPCSKTQAINVEDAVVDTPGEFFESRRLHGALKVASQDVDVVVMMQAADRTDSCFPPGFASGFTKPVLGIISRIDLADDDAVGRAADHLRRAGAATVLGVDSLAGTGFDQVREMLWTRS